MSWFEFNSLVQKKKKKEFNKEEVYQHELSLSLEDRRKRYECGDYYVELKDILPLDQYFKVHEIKIKSDIKPKFAFNPNINQKISHYKGNIVDLELDAIVNAANRSLLGGGGVDGAIHDAAGRNLYYECETLNGCDTGKSKITRGYNLPAKFVIHTVGPMGVHPDLLRSCYETLLSLVKSNNIKTIAICGISTGIYGYPVTKAAHVALQTIREWLEIEENFNAVDRIVFVAYNFTEKEVYDNYLPIYFPLEEVKGDDNLSIKYEEQPKETNNNNNNTEGQETVNTNEVQTNNNNQMVVDSETKITTTENKVENADTKPNETNSQMVIDNETKITTTENKVEQSDQKPNDNSTQIVENDTEKSDNHINNNMAKLMEYVLETHIDNKDNSDVKMETTVDTSNKSNDTTTTTEPNKEKVENTQ